MVKMYVSQANTKIPLAGYIVKVYQKSAPNTYPMHGPLEVGRCNAIEALHGYGN